MTFRVEAPNVAHSAAIARLGPLSAVHRTYRPIRTVAIGVGVILSLVAVLILFAAVGMTNLLSSAVLLTGMILATFYLVIGLAMAGQMVYLYRDGLVHVDRQSVTAIRFEQVQTLERIGRWSFEAALGRSSYRITGGGYFVRISGMVSDSRRLGQRLEHEVRQRGGRVV